MKVYNVTLQTEEGGIFIIQVTANDDHEAVKIAEQTLNESLEETHSYILKQLERIL